jgi:uncharacterized protein YjbI with pentapeptide repeats
MRYHDDGREVRLVVGRHECDDPQQVDLPHSLTRKGGPMVGEQPHWTPCGHDGCIGVRLPTTALCLAHAAEQAPDALEAELKRIGEEGTVDARGVVISAQLLRRLLAAVPDKDDRPVFAVARFEQASFQGEAAFNLASFQSEARFDKARFQGAARFDGANFEGGAGFGGVRFQGGAAFHEASFQSEARFHEASFQGGRAGFSGASFQSGARFDGANFEGGAAFNGASFESEVRFDGANFEGGAAFNGARFQGETGFGGATFEREARFGGAVFEGEARFDAATFKREAGFDKAIFERASRIGPLVAGQLFLDGAVFSENVEIDVATAVLCARRAQFPVGVRLHLRWASVVLDDANLAAPSIVAGVPPFARLDEEDAARRWQRLPPGPRAERSRPRLISMRRADVAGLRVANVDLRACRFAAAHNLDKLRIEGESLFAHSPGWWRARRKTLAEEQRWRASRPGPWRPGDWYPQVCQSPAYPALEPPGALPPVQLAALYRELRKGREDAKDEPGAADFYYGEMEMRRCDPGGPWAERLVLWLYWLTSGYALRAWRALAALAVVVLLAAVMFAFWGFPRSEPGFRAVGIDRSGALAYQQQPADPPPGIERLPAAIRFSARSATALLRGPDRALTPVGEWLEIGLRFAGPVLLGLAVLSVRGRVRR